MERFDETLGVRTQRTLRVNGVEYVQNANGDVRGLGGLVARRQLTEDFISTGAFAHHPENVTMLGRATLYDGREVVQLRVAPPGGEPYEVSLDAKTQLVDELAYPDGDGVSTVDYGDYRVVDGALVPYVEVDSSGNHDFDLTLHVRSARAGGAIDPAVFAPLAQATIDAPAPVNVPLLSDKGHLFVTAQAKGQTLRLLLDTGSQGIFIDPTAARRLGLSPEGRLEVRGVRRMTGQGVAALDSIDIGGATVPIGVVSVLDLSAVAYRGKTVDGVLGYPFFAASEVRIDPHTLTMTLAKPGALPVLGTAIPIDTDRELPEMTATVGRVDARFLLDTGNSNELLVFHHFVKDHPEIIEYGARGPHFAPNSGVGGSSAAVFALVNELSIGPFKLYNRSTDVMLADTGAFADKNDAGNIGLGTLGAFLFTFDYANRTLYLSRESWFDDGRYRARVDSSIPQLRPR